MERECHQGGLPTLVGRGASHNNVQIQILSRQECWTSKLGALGDVSRGWYWFLLSINGGCASRYPRLSSQQRSALLQQSHSFFVALQTESSEGVMRLDFAAVRKAGTFVVRPEK